MVKGCIHKNHSFMEAVNTGSVGQESAPAPRKLSRLPSLPLKRRLRQARRPLIFQVTIRMLLQALPAALRCR